MKNVTITLDDDTAARAKVKAAERNMSLSRFVGEVLREQIRGTDDYERAMRSWFARKLVHFRDPGQRKVTRAELHERAALRKEHEARRKKA